MGFLRRNMEKHQTENIKHTISKIISHTVKEVLPSSAQGVGSNEGTVAKQ